MLTQPDAAATDHQITAYARSVVDGQVPAGKLQRLACARHLRDLEGAAERGFYFDAAAADHAIRFYTFLRHTKGEWAGQPVILSPWQAFIVGSVFGWKRLASGLRRFRYFYIEVPRKNGKSTFAAGIALYCLVADGEAGAEVYSAATKRDQARIVFGEAQKMVRTSPALSRRVRVYVNSLATGDGSLFIPLSSDSKLLDGLNPHLGLIDEVHALKGRDLFDVLDTGMGARRQPLLGEITTSGTDPASLCREHHDYSEAVLEGVLADAAADAWFAFIAAADPDDDPFDPATWAKANPNFGLSVKAEYLEGMAQKARGMPAALATFKQKNLNIWTRGQDRWMDPEVWKALPAAAALDQLAGRRCFMGLDLAQVDDLSAQAKLFPPAGDDPLWHLVCRFWCPADNIAERTRNHRVPYEHWRDKGLIEATPGNITDYAFIRAAIVDDAKVFDVAECSYDRTFAGEIVTALIDEGIAMVPFGQGFYSMGPAMAESMRLIKGSLLAHDHHEVMAWNVANCVVAKDPAGNLKPDKARSREKIDGVSALQNAIGRAMVAADKAGHYDRGGSVRTV